MGCVLKFGQRVDKTPVFLYGWKECYSFLSSQKEAVDFSQQPSVICFPGDGTIDDWQMNGCCKSIEFMLKNAGVSADKMPRIYSLGFDCDTVFHRQSVAIRGGQAAYGKAIKPFRKKHPKEPMDYWQDFFNRYFLPIIENQNGTPKSPEEIKKNFQNITFVTHCHGSIFAFEIEKLLTQKIKTHYPDKVKELMGQIRMLHLASRRSLNNQEIYAKHVHVISQKDEGYVDEFLAYNNLHNAIHRHPIDKKSALISLAENEELLVMRELSMYGEKEDHSIFLNYFAGLHDVKQPNEEGDDEISLVRSLLRRFVLNPQENASLKEMVTEITNNINPLFLTEKRSAGNDLMADIQQEAQADRLLLSLWPQKRANKEIETPSFLLQSNEDGKNLYDRLVGEYQISGDNRDLIELLQTIGNNYFSQDVIINGANMALNIGDYALANRYVQGCEDYSLPSAQLEEAVRGVKPDKLIEILPLLQKLSFKQKDKELYQFLSENAREIKNSSKKIRVQVCLKASYDVVHSPKIIIPLRAGQRRERN